MKKNQVLPFMFFLALMLGCKKDEEVVESTHWDYENPKWENQGYNDCAGLVQSPIDIITSSTVKATLPQIGFNYADFNISVIDNGHTVQVNNTGTSNITYNGKTYSLKQFHFHAKSEHKIDGKQAPVEVHFVHQNPTDGTLLVLGVMMEEGGVDNPSIAKYISSFPTEKEKEIKTTSSIDPTLLFPSSKKYYNYTGSLTTPPCSQGLNWIVFKEKLLISAAQRAAFEKAYDHNYRPTQNVGSRTIFEDL